MESERTPRAAILVCLGLTLLVGGFFGFRFLERRQTDALERRRQEILAAPVPESFRLVRSELRGRGICLKPGGCETRSAYTLWEMPVSADPCSEVREIAERWSLRDVHSLMGCGLGGSVDGMWVVISAGDCTLVPTGRCMNISA